MQKNTGGGMLRATAAAIICHTLWGFSFMASRTALNSAHVFVLLSHRFLLAFLLMHLALGRVRALHLSAGDLGLLLLLGLAQPVLYFFGEQYGLLHSNTIFSGVMIAMIPVVSTLAAAPILKERPTWRQLAFSLLSVSGVIGIGLLSGSSGSLDLIGVLALLLAVVSASAYTLLGRSLSGRTSPFARTYVTLGVGAATFTGMALLRCRGDWNAYLSPLGEPSYLLSLLFLAVLCTVVCFFLSSYAITKLPVARETVFSNLTTAVSVFAGAVFLHEPFSWLGFLCCVVIIVGIWGVQRTDRRS